MLKRMYDHAVLLQADVVICRCQSFDLQTHSYAPMPWSVRVDLLPQKELFSSDEITHNFFVHLSGGLGISFSVARLFWILVYNSRI
jgi:hypothetical protein